MTKAAYSDPNDVRYFAITPKQLAESTVHVVDQLWGVNFSDITLRATGDLYVC